jgi:hydroxymethylpyrimidine/phosphomethylpyrimidine kinase
LAALGCSSVLIKGGHLESGDSDDCLYLGPEQRMVILPGERIATRNNHGTGCTLSSAIASFIACGETIESAVRLAKDYITGAIRAGAEYSIGHGHGPVHHFFRYF